MLIRKIGKYQVGPKRPKTTPTEQRNGGQNKNKNRKQHRKIRVRKDIKLPQKNNKMVDKIK